MDIQVNVSNQQLRLAAHPNRFISGTQEFIRFVFNLTSDWDDLLTFAQFTQNGESYNQYLDESNGAYLPSEIGAGTCTIMLYGSNDDRIATTNYLTLTIDENILISDASSTDISQSLYTQLVSMVNNFTIEDGSVTSDKLNANAKTIINVAGKTPDGEPLSSDNIEAAIQAALLESSNIYIPAGEYNLNTEITTDCHIYMDDHTVLYSNRKLPIFNAINCSFSLTGGVLKSGEEVTGENYEVYNEDFDNDHPDPYIVGDTNLRKTLEYDAGKKRNEFLMTIPEFVTKGLNNLEPSDIQTLPADKQAEYAELKKVNDSANTMIWLSGCHDCLIERITVPYHNNRSAIHIGNTVRVVVERCNFDKLLNSGIYIGGHNENLTIRNNVFKNCRYAWEYNKVYTDTPIGEVGTDDFRDVINGQEKWFHYEFKKAYYCHFVYSGGSSKTHSPTGGLIMENNYCNNSEDSGLDTHGARNVIIRGNTVNNAVCSITAYNDNRRAWRPAGWNMENVVIENNVCNSKKNNNVNSDWKHPFILLGSANGHSSTESGPSGDYPPYAENPGRHSSFSNCVVRNNSFKSTANTDALIHLNSVGQNIIIENNTLDYGVTNNSNTIVGTWHLGIRLCNNKYITNNKVSLGARSVCVIDDVCYNSITTDEYAYLNYYRIANYAYSLRNGSTSAEGDLIRYPNVAQNVPFIASGFGYKVNDLYTGDMSFNIRVDSNGKAHIFKTVNDQEVMVKHNLIPFLAVNVSGEVNGSAYNNNLTVNTLIDVDYFTFISAPPAGAYTMTLRKSFVDGYLITAQFRATTNVYSSTEESATVVVSDVPANTLCMATRMCYKGYSRSGHDYYCRVIMVQNDTNTQQPVFVTGYALKDWLNRTFDVPD